MNFCHFDHDEITMDELVGLTFTNVVREPASENSYIERYSEKLVFTIDDDRKIMMCHVEACCEHVHLEDICGDLEDLVGTPILLSEAVTNKTEKPDAEFTNEQHETWTFYKMATAKGHVTIRWFGTSNGCYSETADLFDVRVENVTPDVLEQPQRTEPEGENIIWTRMSIVTAPLLDPDYIAHLKRLAATPRDNMVRLSGLSPEALKEALWGTGGDNE